MITKAKIINFRVTDVELQRLQAFVEWINKDEQMQFRRDNFSGYYWHRPTISDVIRYQLGRAHDVIQNEISECKTVAIAAVVQSRSRKTSSRSRQRKTSHRSKRKTHGNK